MPENILNLTIKDIMQASKTELRGYTTKLDGVKYHAQDKRVSLRRQGITKEYMHELNNQLNATKLKILVKDRLDFLSTDHNAYSEMDNKEDFQVIFSRHEQSENLEWSDVQEISIATLSGETICND